jgi:hypothetical protein
LLQVAALEKRLDTANRDQQPAERGSNVAMEVEPVVFFPSNTHNFNLPSCRYM